MPFFTRFTKVWTARVIALFALMLLCQSFASVYAEEGESKKPKAEGEASSGGKKDKEGAAGHFGGDVIYVHLAPMVLPVVTDNGAEQIITIIIDIEVKNFDAADQMHSNMPKVQDAILKVMYGGLSNGSLRDGNMLDLAKIKFRITAALDQVLGAGLVNNVLIQGVSQRML